MRMHLRNLLVLALLVGPVVGAAAQTEHITPFTGTWKLNPARSKFDPGPPFRSFTLTFAPDGTRHLDLLRAEGTPFRAVLPWSDGKEVVVEAPDGMGKVTATSKIEGREFRDTWKANGNVIEQVHGVVSADGTTLTITVDGTDPHGRAYRNQLTFEKRRE